MRYQEYIYHFKGGGWNSEYAASKRHAIAKATDRWKRSPELVIDRSSFKPRSENEGEYKALMNLFW